MVNAYSARWLARGFPWVYPKEVVADGGEPSGSWVRVRDEAGKVLAHGLRDHGWLAVRVVRHGSEPADEAWIRGRLDRAAALRDQVVDAETTGYRLVHGENDGLPGLRIDWWSHFAVVILDSPAVAALLPTVVAWLEETRSPRGVYLCYRPDPRDTVDLAAVEPPAGWIAGHAPSGPVRVTERGMGMLVRPGEGPDVGLYADMREVRRWLEPAWGGRSVLNTFAYTGAFSVAAALGGASEVVSVDLSERFLDRLEANYAANELDPSAYEQLAMDTFKALDRFRRQDRQFDLVILDPPSFSRSDEGVWSAKRDMPRLVAAAIRVLAPGGWMVAASNQGELSPRDFRGLVLKGLDKVGASGQALLWGGQGPDFPAATTFPEGRYLKVGVWRVLR